MKVCHWSMYNGSGMNAVAKTLMRAERRLGLDSYLINVQETPSDEWDQYADADVHVPHTHFPNEMRKRLTRPLKMAFVGHGTPEYVTQSAITESTRGYGAGDSLQLWMYWMKTADAICTFWPRHQAIMQSMADKNTKVHLVPLGLDLDYWRAGKSKGKFLGRPSVMISENSHFMKWAYDLFICWPWVYEKVPDACLHATAVPTDQHRIWFPIINRNGTHYGAHISPNLWPQEELRHVFNSIDLYANLVRYGDHNRVGMEASLAGARVISYWGNPYADFWIREGDQREMARELVKICKGEREPRADKTPIPSDNEMAIAMYEVYLSIV